MAKTKAPIEVTILSRKGKKRTQYTYAIDNPGPGGKKTILEWYVTSSNARRAAAKELNAVLVKEPSKITYKTYKYMAGDREVVFINKKK